MFRKMNKRNTYKRRANKVYKNLKETDFEIMKSNRIRQCPAHAIQIKWWILMITLHFTIILIVYIQTSYLKFWWSEDNTLVLQFVFVTGRHFNNMMMSGNKLNVGIYIWAIVFKMFITFPNIWEKPTKKRK